MLPGMRDGWTWGRTCTGCSPSSALWKVCRQLFYLLLWPLLLFYFSLVAIYFSLVTIYFSLVAIYFSLETPSYYSLGVAKYFYTGFQATGSIFVASQTDEIKKQHVAKNIDQCKKNTYPIGCVKGKNARSEKLFFRWRSVSLAFSTIERAFLWHEGWGGWGHSCQLLHHSWRKKVQGDEKKIPLKISCLGLLDHWKGLFVAWEVRGWCHECHFLHHEGRRVSSKSPEWCKKWHEWHHPLTSRATTRPFQRSRRPKITDFSRKKSFCHFGLFVATRDAKVGTRDTNPSPLVPQKGLCKGLEGPK